MDAAGLFSDEAGLEEHFGATGEFAADSNGIATWPFVGHLLSELSVALFLSVSESKAMQPRKFL